jgi:hypothetical protein
MKTLMTILGCLFIAALLAPLLSAAATTSLKVKPGSLRSIKRAFGLHTGVMQVNALTDGTHANGIIGHLLADAALSTRHLLVQRGSDADHIEVGTATSIPLGVCPDEPSAAEEPAAVILLGAAKGTVLMVASEAMATPDVDVYAAAGGKIALTGLVKVGILRTTAAADGDQCEVEPCIPTLQPNGSVAVAGATLAIPVTKRVALKTTGGAEALTLADGLPGQKLSIILSVDGGDGTLTPTTKTGFATIVFADAGDRADLEFVDATRGWIIQGLSGVAAPPVTTV